jgi:MFS family permease
MIPLTLRQEPLWTRSFVVLTCSYFLLFLSLHLLLSPFPAYMEARFHPGKLTLSLVTATFAISAIAARFLGAYLMRMLHRNRILAAGLLLAGAAAAAYPYASSVVVVLILRSLYGIGFGLASTVIPTMISQIIPARRMGEGIGFFGYSTSLSMSIGPAAGIWLLQAYGFQALAWTGAAAAALVIPLLWGGRGIPAQPERKMVPPGTGAARQGRVNPMTLWPAALNMLLSLIYGGLLGFLALYGKEIGIPQIGLFFLLSVLTIVAVRAIAGRIFDRRGHAVVLVPAALSVMGSMLWLSYARSFPAIAGCALLFGAGFGAIQLTTQAWMLSMTDRHHYGAVNSLYYNSTDLGVGAGSMLLGAVASAAGYAGMYRFSAGFMGLFLLVYLFACFAEQRSRLRTAAAGEQG